MTRLLALAALLLLAACGKDKPAPPPQPEPPRKTVIDTQLKALEKAKTVEGTVEQQKQDIDKKVDQDGQ